MQNYMGRCLKGRYLWLFLRTIKSATITAPAPKQSHWNQEKLKLLAAGHKSLSFSVSDSHLIYLLHISQHSIKDPSTRSQSCSAESDNQSNFQQTLAHSFELQLLMALQGSLETRSYFRLIFKALLTSNQQWGLHPASLCRDHLSSLVWQASRQWGTGHPCVWTITWLLLTLSMVPVTSLCTNKRDIFRETWMTGIEAITDLNNPGCTAVSLCKQVGLAK